MPMCWSRGMATSLGGWPWYDVARLINHENDSLDKSDEGMTARLDQLNEDTEGMLDLIYVDVYHKTRWPMYTLVSKINSMGMAMATEYPSAVDQHSVWAHHVGAHVTQDSLAGNLIRFVNGHQMLAAYKRPKYYKICEKLPHTPTGKLQRSIVREHAAEDFAQGLLHR